MLKFITGKEVLALLEIRDFQLFEEYVKNGLLQPYDQLGKPKPPPDISLKLSRLKISQTYLTFHWQSKASEIFIEELSWLVGIDQLRKETKNLEKELSQIHNIFSWEDYSQIDSDMLVKMDLKNLVDSLFLKEEVLKHQKPLSKEAIKPQPEALKKQENVFRKEGPSWTITYEGKTLSGLKGKGFELIRYLILYKGKVFNIDELRIEVDKILPNEEKSLSEIDLDHSDDDREAVKEGIDSRAKIYGKSMEKLKAYRVYLQNEIRKSEIENDPARKAKFEKEFEEFNKYCTQYFNLRGKSRKDRDDTVKTKDRLCKRIERALNSIKKHDDNTWRHFYHALNPINNYFQSYQPDRDIDWLTG